MGTVDCARDDFGERRVQWQREVWSAGGACGRPKGDAEAAACAAWPMTSKHAFVPHDQASATPRFCFLPAKTPFFKRGLTESLCAVLICLLEIALQNLPPHTNNMALPKRIVKETERLMAEP